jgi:tetratricopeptide (TPR) repeat protein
MNDVADSSINDKSPEGGNGASTNGLNGGEILLGSKKQKIEAGTALAEYNRLTDAMRLAQLASTPENSTLIAKIDLEFGKYYLSLDQLDLFSATKAKAYVEDAAQIYKHNHNGDLEMKALEEELELVRKIDPNPTQKLNEKTEEQQLQQRIAELTQFNSAIDDYEQATRGDYKVGAIATSLDHLGKAYANQDDKEQADKCFQKALNILDNSDTKDQKETLEVLQDYAAFLHKANYGNPSLIDDRIKQLSNTAGGAADQIKESDDPTPPYAHETETQLLRKFNLTAEIFGKSSVEFADIASELGDFYKAQGPQFDGQARSYYGQALSVYFRADQPIGGAVKTLVSYADVLQSSDPEKANQLRERGSALVTLSAYTQTFSENIEFPMSPEDLAENLTHLASSYDKVGNTSKAEELFNEAVKVHQNNKLDSTDSTYELYAEFLKSHDRNQEAKYYTDLSIAEN